MKHESALHCDELVSLAKTRLTGFVGRLSPAKMRELDRALVAALDLDVHALAGRRYSRWHVLPLATRSAPARALTLAPLGTSTASSNGASTPGGAAMG